MSGSSSSSGRKWNAATLGLVAAILVVSAIIVRGIGAGGDPDPSHHHSSQAEGGSDAGGKGSQGQPASSAQSATVPAAQAGTRTPDMNPNSGTPPTGLESITIPPVTDTSNQDADVNWSPWDRGYPGYSFVHFPAFPDPSYRVECMDSFTGAKIIMTDSSSCPYASADRYQSTTTTSIVIKRGFVRSIKN